MREEISGGGVARGTVTVQALGWTLAGCLLCLAAENAVLLFVLGPALQWPAALADIGVALRVGRVLVQALGPWLALACAALVSGAAAMWAALRIRQEVRHA